MPEATIAPLPDPSGFAPDSLTEQVCNDARKLIEQTIEAELTALLAAHAEEKTVGGYKDLLGMTDDFRESTQKPARAAL